MSEKSAKLIQEFLDSHSITKVEFAKVVGIGRTSLYKYLAGEPIHPRKAKQIEDMVLKNYRYCIPHEKLIE